MLCLMSHRMSKRTPRNAAVQRPAFHHRQQVNFWRYTQKYCRISRQMTPFYVTSNIGKSSFSTGNNFFTGSFPMGIPFLMGSYVQCREKIFVKAKDSHGADGFLRLAYCCSGQNNFVFQSFDFLLHYHAKTILLSTVLWDSCWHCVSVTLEI